MSRSSSLKKQKKVDPENALIEKALKVSDRIQFEDVYLLGNTCKWKSFASDKENNFKVDNVAQGSLSNDKQNLLSIVNFVVDMQNEDNTSIAEISVDYLLVYSIKDTKGLTKKHYDAFSTYNAVFNAWPYLREFIQNITSRMQIPTLTLPVYRFGNEGLLQTKDYAINSEDNKPKRKKIKTKTVKK